MKYALLLATTLATACYGEPRSAEFACNVTADCTGNRVCDDGYCVLPTEVSVDAPPATDDSDPAVNCNSFNSKLFDGCAIPQPTGALALTAAGNYTIDTGNGTVTGPSGPITVATQMVGTNRLISVDSFTVASDATIRVTGGAPLIIASWRNVSIAGKIDAGSHGTTSAGAGSNVNCGARAPGIGEQSGIGAGGAGGGGFAAAGGAGGQGDSGDGGAGGLAINAMPLLGGGCNGAKGGQGDNNSQGGNGGLGGGAIAIATPSTIQLDGSITASGGGGAGGNADVGGGGGGGSGGMISLEATTITMGATAALTANGGGGGAGASGNVNGGAGGDGSATTATRATGGTGNNGSGAGGIGGAGATLAGATAANTNSNAAGGGGGSAGFIAIAGTVEGTGTISPARVAR
jgi:hypothetical protein